MLIPEQLDNQSFDEILNQAIKQISLLTPEWTNHNPSDPGVMILELFSWYKEVQQYHLNALSLEHELAYLKLLGASPDPQRPAKALLSLSGEGMVEQNAVFRAEDIPFETTASLAVVQAQVTSLQRSDQLFTDLEQVKRGGGKLEFCPFIPGQDLDFTLFFDRTLPVGMPLQLWFQIEEEGQNWQQASTFHPYVTIRGEYWDQGRYRPLTVLEDHTQSFFHSGIFRFQLPPDGHPSMTGQGFPLRFTVEDGSYVKAPVICGIHFNAVEVLQRETISQCRIYHSDGKRDLLIEQDALSGTGHMEVYGVEGERWVPLKWENVSPGRIRLSSEDFETVGVVTWKEEGELFRRLGRANGIACFSLPLPEKNLLPDSLELLVWEPDGNWYFWQRTEDLNSGGASSRQYYFDALSNALQFGDGEHGQAPEGELLLLSWSTSLGEMGNIQEGYLTAPSGSTVSQAACVRPAQGGRAAETAEECFRRVKRELEHCDRRCVTLGDLERAALNVPGTYLKKVRAFVKEQAPNQVFLALETLGDNRTLHPGVVENLKQALLPRLMINTKLNFLAPVYVQLKIYVQLSVKPQFSISEEGVRQVLSDYFEGPDMHFGAVISKNELLDHLYLLPQLQSVDMLELSFSGGHGTMQGGDIVLEEGCLPRLGQLNLSMRTNDF